MKSFKKWEIAVVVLVCLIVTQGLFAQVLKIEKGKKVKLNYSLSINGEVVDSTTGDEPLEFVQGEEILLPALEKSLEGMQKGEKKKIVLSPADGYGPLDDEAFKELPKTILPPEIEPQPGMIVELQTEDGQNIPAVIWEIKEDTIIFNMNHPLAGQSLEFDVEVVDVE